MPPHILGALGLAVLSFRSTPALGYNGRGLVAAPRHAARPLAPTRCSAVSEVVSESGDDVWEPVSRGSFDAALAERIASGDEADLDDDSWGEYVFEEPLEDPDEGVVDVTAKGAEEGKDGYKPGSRGSERHEEWDTSMLPLIAVVGRPNVGKSMIVNRLSRQFQGGSITYDVPGITRDRTYRPGYWNDKEFRVVDTGGIVFQVDADDDVFLPQIREQALVALAESRAAILVVDGQAGPTSLDEELAVFLRKQKVPVFLAVNKCESFRQGELLASAFWALGLGTPWPVSGIHGSGLAELLEEIIPHLNFDEAERAVRVHCRVAIVGRPNVGKSSLLNRLTGQNRAIVSEVAGTTRDSIDSSVTFDEKRYAFVDTAGIRRKARVKMMEEKLMVNRAIKAIRRAQVVLLLIDALEGVTDQDMQLGELIRDAGAACVVVVNKWDLVDEERSDKLYRQSRDYLAQNLPTVAWAETLFISAKTGFNANRIYKSVDDVLLQHERRISTALLNQVLQDAVDWQKPPSSNGGKQGKIYYCTQVGRRPPAVAIFVNDPTLFPQSYKRYLEGRFRDALGFKGTPLRLIFRGKTVVVKGTGVPWAD